MTLNARKAKAIAALLDSDNRNNTAAAVAAGVSRRQLQEWLASDAEFQAALQSAQSALIAEATMRLTALSGLAVGALAECLGPYTNEKTAMQAATIVLDRILRFRELDDMERRLAALEAERENNG